MKLAIISSSSFCNKDQLYTDLDQYQGKLECIISAGEEGAPKLAHEYVRERGGTLLLSYPAYQKDGSYDEGAALKNKARLLKACTHVLSYFDGESKGCSKALLLAKKLNKPTKVVLYENPLKGKYVFSGSGHPLALDVPCQFTIKGHQFGSARQALVTFAAAKLGLQEIVGIALKMDMTKKTAAAKLREIWADLCLPDLDQHLEGLLYTVNFAKFAQNEDLKKFLVETKGEVAWATEDAVLGTGIKKSDPALYDLSKWGGNLLGKSIDKVHAKLV